eukprot:258892-Prorocentrum_minimum.AAC.1
MKGEGIYPPRRPIRRGERAYTCVGEWSTRHRVSTISAAPAPSRERYSADHLKSASGGGEISIGGGEISVREGVKSAAPSLRRLRRPRAQQGEVLRGPPEISVRGGEFSVRGGAFSVREGEFSVRRG